MKVLLIVGSVREGRTADKILKLVSGALDSTDVEVDIADLKDINLPFYNEPIPPIYAKGDYNDPIGDAWAQRVKDADAVILLSPEYNHSTSAVLKNAIDWAYEGWDKKLVLLVTWGVEGGRHAQAHLIDILDILHAEPVPLINICLNDLDENGNLIEQELMDVLTNDIRTILGDAGSL